MYKTKNDFDYSHSYVLRCNFRQVLSSNVPAALQKIAAFQNIFQSTFRKTIVIMQL